MKRSLASITASLLVVVLITPTTFFIAPERSQAISAAIIADIKFPTQLMQLAKDTITSIAAVSSEAAQWALVINTYVLQPLAFILSGNMLKKMTSGVISFVVNGAANGTGAPQFVQNLQGHMQMVGDNKAMAFFMQFGRNSNSPFASAISSSLRLNYLQSTSLAGFFAANQNTLHQYSPNVNAFLNGNWSQGGVAAWFALTTQNQNNPYTFYQTTQTELASAIASAQAARLSELNWGKGFLSWCGAREEGSTGIEEGDDVVIGTAPGDTCYREDGTYGTIKTPGSVILPTLTKVLGSTQDKLVQMGSLAKEITSIMGNIATVLSTINFAKQILGGGDSGGFTGGLISAADINSPTRRYLESGDFAGASTTLVYQNALTLPVSGEQMTERIVQYEGAWTTIRAAANSALTALTSLKNFCSAAATGTGTTAFKNAAADQAADAQTAIDTLVTPVLSQATSAFTTAATARTVVDQIKRNLENPDSNTGTGYAADIQTLQTLPPTMTDIAHIQQEAMALGAATANPEGSLIVSGGSIVDRMNLLATNAEALKESVCTRRTATGSRN